MAILQYSYSTLFRCCPGSYLIILIVILLMVTPTVYGNVAPWTEEDYLFRNLAVSDGRVNPNQGITLSGELRNSHGVYAPEGTAVLIEVNGTSGFHPVIEAFVHEGKFGAGFHAESEVGYCIYRASAESLPHTGLTPYGVWIVIVDTLTIVEIQPVPTSEPSEVPSIAFAFTLVFAAILAYVGVLWHREEPA